MIEHYSLRETFRQGRLRRVNLLFDFLPSPFLNEVCEDELLIVSVRASSLASPLACFLMLMF